MYKLFVLTFIVATSAVTACSAEETANRWFANVGPAWVFLPSLDSTVAVNTGAGFQTVPGGKVSGGTGMALVMELGYDLTPALSAKLTVGTPIRENLYGSGTMASLGKAGAIDYGPAILGAQYRFNTSGGLKPYVGVGAVYLIVIRNYDGAVQNLKVQNAWGSAFELGADYPVTKNVSAFVNVKKIFLKTDVHGNVGVPVMVNVTLDPVITWAGARFRF